MCESGRDPPLVVLDLALCFKFGVALLFGSGVITCQE